MKSKLLITVCLIALLAVVLCMPALASETDESDDAAATVIAQLGRLLELYPDNPKVMKIIDDAQRWLSREENAATITPEAAGAVTTEVGAALATAGDAKAASQLSASKQVSIVNNVARAASSAGLKLEVSSDYSSFALKDSSGNVVSGVTLGNPIKQTGTGVSIAGIVLIGIIVTLIIAFTAAVYIRTPAKKKVPVRLPGKNSDKAL